MTGRARAVFLGADGRLRSGWAILVFCAVAVASTLSLFVLARLLGYTPPAHRQLDTPRLVVPHLIGLAAFLLATLVGSRAVSEPFAASGLGGAGRSRQAALGLGAGVLAASFAAALPVLFGKASLAVGTLGGAELLAAGALQLALLTPVALSEEIAARGFPFRQLCRGLGGPLAVLSTSALFGLAHLGNPGAGWVAAVNVALAGAWFAVLTLRSGSLWPAIGAHLSWNWVEGFVFGHPVSGIPPGASLLRPAQLVEGPWTGGSFGPEGAAPTSVVLLLAIAATLLVRPGRK